MTVTRVQAADAGEAATLQHIARTQQVGTHTSSLGEVRSNPHAGIKGGINFDGSSKGHVVSGGVARYQAADPLPSDMVQLPNGMRTTALAAQAAGIAVIESDGVFLTEQGEHDVGRAMSRSNAQQVAVPKEQQIMDAGNAALDHLSDTMGHSRYTALANAVRDGDDLAFSVLPEAIVKSFTLATLNHVKDMGFTSLLLFEYLPEDWAQEARDAIIHQNVTGIRVAAQRAIENLDELTSDDEFISDVEDAGGSIVGHGRNALLVCGRGQSVSLLQAMMTGVLTRG